MWIKRSEYERLVAESALAEQLAKAEARAEAAESALAIERKERMRDVRHVMSMWLRSARSYPLPATSEEKAEAKAEKEQQANEPPKLTADQEARLKAVREWGLKNGFTEEQVNQKFMASLSSQVDE